MPEKDKEKELAYLMASPAQWGEKYLCNRDGSPRKYWPHQVEDMECQECNIIHKDGRDTGKTVSLSTLALHFAFTNKGGTMLIAAPHQGHLDTIIDEIDFQINRNRELMDSLAMNAQGKPKITRKPYCKIEFANDAVIYFRPAGAYGDAFRSLHVDYVCVDEGAWLTEQAWKALRQCLKANGILRIYSTPNGMRETTYYRLIQSPNWKVFHWPSMLNPSWDKKREEELLEFYGGRESAGWQHEVMGEHGRQSYGAFNIEYLTLCRQEVPEYHRVTITGEELRDCDSEDAVEERLDMLLNLARLSGTFWVGADTGYTSDPTEIVVFKESQEPNERMKLTMVLRVHMEHVAYPHISACLSLIDRYYNPAGIGLDNGGNGLSIVQELTSLDRYRPLGLKDRLRGFDFGSSIAVYQEENGKENKKPTKEHMTQLINLGLQRRELVLPINDVDIESQFTTHTYTFNLGRIIYSKGNDHLVDAVRCLMLVREQFTKGDIWGNSNENLPVPILTDPIFV